MCFLGVLHTAVVGARTTRHRFLSVEGLRQRASRGQRSVRQRRRVGPHVGDEALLVQPLRDLHRARRGETELPRRLLLERRGDEGRSWRSPVRLRVDGRDAITRRHKRRRERVRPCLIQQDRSRRIAENAVGREICAGGDASPTDRVEVGGERLVAFGLEPSGEAPPRRRVETHPLPLALDDDARRNALHSSGGQALHHLFPQHRRELVAIEAIEDATRFLRVHEPPVEITRVRDRVVDRGLRNLVKDHPFHRDLGREDLQKVPSDRLTLAVLVGREVQLTCVLQQRAQLRDLGFLFGGDDVEGLETVVDVDAEARPALRLVSGGHFRGRARQVADMTDRRLDDVVIAQKTRDRLRLRRRFHDD